MNTQQLLEEIRETNLSYLILAQHLIQADRPEALYRLGLEESAADMIEHLTPGQLLKIASSSTVMCKFRFQDSRLWELLCGKQKQSGDADRIVGLHAAILQAGMADAPADLASLAGEGA